MGNKYINFIITILLLFFILIYLSLTFSKKEIDIVNYNLLHIKIISNALELYKVNFTTYPEDLKLLVYDESKMDGKGPYIQDENILKDYWGDRFKYSTRNNGLKYTIESKKLNKFLINLEKLNYYKGLLFIAVSVLMFSVWFYCFKANFYNLIPIAWSIQLYIISFLIIFCAQFKFCSYLNNVLVFYIFFCYIILVSLLSLLFTFKNVNFLKLVNLIYSVFVFLLFFNNIM
jgi:hypothetical protein